MEFDDVVVLVPGFLGFSRTGAYSYFADRVSALVRGALESKMKSSARRYVPVVPVCTLPADRLAARQETLVSSLAGLADRMGGVKRFHLVGHSAGGVDAQLLTCDRPLGTPRWTPQAERVREKVASVIGIAAPHWGTCLAEAPIARLAADPLREFARDPLKELEHLPGIAKQVLDLTSLVRFPADAQAAEKILLNLPDGARFLANLVLRRGLIEDLRPKAMEATRQHWRKGRVRIRSFVTMTPPSPTADAFYQDLQKATGDTHDAPPTDPIRAAVTLLNERARAAIRSRAFVPAFTDGTNDGVVNSARQLVDPGDPDELAGIVVGDHADVIGHYDRVDALIAGKALNMGLFHSGAAFGDNEFYKLYGQVADLLAEVIL
jgi:pimeloyl-ACP methyl ester carboxylesterase